MTDCKRCDDTSTDGLEDGLRGLINAQLLLGKELLKVLGGAGSALGSAAGRMRLPRGSSCCDVPEPCWMPRALGQIDCQLAPGDRGTLCLVVTNGDFRPHHVQFVASGRSAGLVQFSQAGALLGPKERIAVTATLTVPRDGKADPDCRCIDHEALVWVRGCRNHYLRWTVTEVAAGKVCCHEIAVDDDPDYVHHWYDHFYVTRPCFGAATVPGQPGVSGVVR